jgi:GT2 family glycosyltransferase
MDLKNEIEALQRRVEILKRASISAYPNPIQVDGSGVGVTTLSYTFLESEPVEIHIGSPHGPLFASPDKSGKSETGKWVLDGTVFFLQDVSDGKPLTQEHTLATVIVRVTREDELATRLAEKEAELRRITDSLNWRLFGCFVKDKYIRPAYYWMRNVFRSRESAPSQKTLYQDWARRCEEFRYDSVKAEKDIERFNYKPTISIIMPVYNGSQEHLSRAVDSVLNQYYPFWELCICDDASTAPHVRNVLEDYATRDKRIKVSFSEKNGGIADASNRALELATGEFIGLLDHDDEITPDALYEVGKTLQAVNADLVYSDEDKLEADGSRCEPFFKPAWAPDLLLSCNYICHFGVYRKSLVDEIGGFRDGFDGSQDYDLVLRFTEKSDKIVHIPKILYHWRKASGSVSASALSKPYAYEAGKKALRESLRRRDVAGDVATERFPGYYRVKRKIKSADKVSILIPTRDRLDLLEKCLDSIERATEYKNYEIVIINNGSQESATLEYLERTPHRVIHDASAGFNFARLNNQAAKDVDGEFLLLLNNDVEVISAEWLSGMIEHAQRPEVGAVGAKLLYPDNRIQHAGVVLGINDVAGHSHKYLNGFEDFGYFGFPDLIRNYSAVTGACLMIRRTLFEEIGGLDEENLAVAYNDIDLCLRLRKTGYLIVYTPYALLYHKESASRGYRWNQAEISYMMKKWRDEILNDPYYNPNLTRDAEDFSIDLSKPESLYPLGVEDNSFREVTGVHEDIKIGQKITTEENNFCAIGIKFGKSPHIRKGIVTVRVRQKDEPASDLRVAATSASAIRDNERQVFVFEPIPNSRGTSYYVFVEYGKQKPSHRENPLLLGAMSFSAFCQKQFRCSFDENSILRSR